MHPKQRKNASKQHLKGIKRRLNWEICK